MKSQSPALLKLAVVIALASPLAVLADTQAKASCTKTAQSCEQGCPELRKLEAQVLAQPAKVGELLAGFVARNPDALEGATLGLVSTLSAKLPPEQLKPALGQLMSSATGLLSARMQEPTLAATATEEERNQAQFEQDLRVAVAVQGLTRRAVEAVKSNLTAPAQAIAPEADGSYPNGALLIDPQVYASLMKSSMEQVIRGSIAGLGTRANRIPEVYLPALTGITADKASYAYSLNDAPAQETIPAALAAPMDEKPADKK